MNEPYPREINRLNAELQNINNRYQKALQQISQLIQANTQLKRQLDQMALQTNNLITQNVQKNRQQYENYIQQVIQEKNQLKEGYDELQKSKNQKLSEIEHLQKDKQSLESQLNKQKEEIARLVQQLSSFKEQAQNPQKQARKQQTEKYLQQVLKQNDKSRKKIILLEADHKAELSEATTLKTDLERCKSSLRDAQLMVLRQKQDKLKCRQEVEEEYRLSITKVNHQLTDLQKINSKLSHELDSIKMHRNYKYIEHDNQVPLEQTSKKPQIQEQLSKLKADFDELAQQRHEFSLSKAQAEQQTQIKLLSAVKEVEVLKEEKFLLRRQLDDLRREKDGLHSIEQQAKTAHQEKHYLQEKVHILEAMHLAQKCRRGTPEYNRIKQFESRINILLQEEGRPPKIHSKGLHEIVIFKAYVKELADRLALTERQKQRFQSKYNQMKEEVSRLQQRYAQKVTHYKQKLINYDKIVARLYEIIESNLQNTEYITIKRQFDKVISLYEDKMTVMSEEVLRLRKEAKDREAQCGNYQQQLQEKEYHLRQGDKYSRHLTEENANLRQLVNDLSKNILALEMKLKERTTYQEESGEKESKILELEKQLRQIEQGHQNRFNEQQHYFLANQSNAEHQINYLLQQLASERKINAQLSNQKEAHASELLQKIRTLQSHIRQLQSEAHKRTGPQNQKQQQQQLILQLTAKINGMALQRQELQRRERTSLERMRLLEQDFAHEREILSSHIETLNAQLASKHAQMMKYYQESNRLPARNENEYAQMKAAIAQLELVNSENQRLYDHEISSLNSQIIALRTSILTIKHQVQEKNDVILALNNQIFALKLELEGKESGDSHKDKQEMMHRYESACTRIQELTLSNEEHLAQFVLLFAEIESLRARLNQIEVQFARQIKDYQQKLKEIGHIAGDKSIVVNFELLHDVECAHGHLIRLEQLVNSSLKQQSSISTIQQHHSGHLSGNLSGHLSEYAASIDASSEYNQTKNNGRLRQNRPPSIYHLFGDHLLQRTSIIDSRQFSDTIAEEEVSNNSDL